MLVASATIAFLAVPIWATPLHRSSKPLTPGSTNLKLAPLVTNPAAKLIQSQYIVVLKPEVTAQDVDVHIQLVQQYQKIDALDGSTGLTHVYRNVLKGYSGMFSDDALDKIRALPEVDYVEPDQLVCTCGEPFTANDVENQAPWGLARISHRDTLNFGTFNKYIHDPSGGNGVDVYSLDTGINTEHVDFEGRATWGKTITPGDVDEDGNGHGTHCAGIIAGKKYGVAKSANVYAVKVLYSNGCGPMSAVIAGISFASSAAQARAIAAIKEYRSTGRTSYKGSVADMPFSTAKSEALDAAVNNTVRDGLHVAVAAGNDNTDACNFSPAAAELAITVAGSALDDSSAYFSNYGKCVDTFAPALNIQSAWIGSKHAVKTVSGTSMSSSHTAGLLAYLLSTQGTPTFNPSFDIPKSNHAHYTSNWELSSAVMAILPRWISALISTSIAKTLENVALGGNNEQFYTRPLRLRARVREREPEVPISLFRTLHRDPYNQDGTLDVTKFGGVTPAQLKAALLEIATRDVLSDIPDNTPNKVVFNNATGQ